MNRGKLKTNMQFIASCIKLMAFIAADAFVILSAWAAVMSAYSIKRIADKANNK